jgi:hypothetical protein
VTARTAKNNVMWHAIPKVFLAPGVRTPSLLSGRPLRNDAPHHIRLNSRNGVVRVGLGPGLGKGLGMHNTVEGRIVPQLLTRVRDNGSKSQLNSDRDTCCKTCCITC